MADLTGRAKAAVFLLSLDENRAVNIIEHFDEEELLSLRKAVDSLESVDAEVLEQVYAEFADGYKNGLAPAGSGAVYLEGLVERAMGKDEALRLFGPPPEPPAPPPNPLESLSSADPRMLAMALSKEHPQMVAAILTYLDPTVASEILLQKNVEGQTDLVRRIASLKGIPNSAMIDVERAVSEMGLDFVDLGDVDGVETAAGILNAMIGDSATDVLDLMGEESPDEADTIRRAMFTFDNLVDADIRGLQQMLREVQSDTLLIALKNASEELRERIFGCMSQRAALMLRDELELMAPMRLAEIQEAQQQLVDLAMRLMADGKLTVAGRGEEMI
jgi:flagellar motor switch protein FliG